MARHQASELKHVVTAGALIAAAVGLGLPTQARTSQETTAAQGSGVIAGRVVDAVTGEPVPDALVDLRGYATRAPAQPGPPTSPVPRAARTASDGQFAFNDLPAGQYGFSAIAEGYLLGGAGRHRPGDIGIIFELRSDERLRELVVKLWPAGSISGMLRDERGEPLVQAPVRALVANYEGGQRFWVANRNALVKPALSDDRGMYRLTGLEPAEYILVVAAPDRGPLPRRMEGGVTLETLETTYSGGARSARDAEIIRLGAGEQRTGIDFQVADARIGGFAVAGRIVAPGSVGSMLRLRLVSKDVAEHFAASFEELTTTTSADGTFSFASVPAGEYRLQAWRFPEVPKGSATVTPEGIASTVGLARGQPLPPVPSEPTWMVDLPITLNRAVTGLEVPLTPAARISGRIVFEGHGRAPVADELLRIPVHAMPALGRTLGIVPGSRVEPDGRFTTVGLPPGAYALWIRPERSAVEGLAEWGLMSVRAGGTDLVGRPVQIGATDLDVIITFSTVRRATVRGRVRDASGSPRPDVQVIVFARDPAKRGTGLVGVPQCVARYPVDHEANYGLSIHPACGALIAAPLNPPRLWEAPEYLESLVPFAVPAEVSPGEARTMDLVARP